MKGKKVKRVKSVRNMLALLLAGLFVCGVVSAGGAAETPGEVDVDFTTLSSTMVFGEMFNMMTNPEEYLGKTVKMRGAYASAHSDETGNDYHFVIVADAAACCQQGMEFIVNGSQTPGDYPAQDTRIEVVGSFDSYKVLDYVHYYIKTDTITIP